MIRKLDKEPDRAEAWAWSEDGCRIDAGKAVVTLSPTDGQLSTLAEVHCDCLLAPRCLHVLSVVHRLEVAGQATVEEVVEAVAEASVATEAQQATASALHETLLGVLWSGASSVGVIAQGQLLRDAHRARGAKLPRLAGAATRIAVAIRALSERSPAFEAQSFAEELASALEVAARVAAGTPGPDDLGVARRSYTTVGSLRLHGLFTEPVVTDAGYAGAVTWGVAANGRLHAVHDVRPGEADRAWRTYDAGIDVGDATLSHRELGRRGLFLSDATASASGRLGRGKAVRAVASGASTWQEGPVAARFSEPLGLQLTRILEAGSQPSDVRDEGHDLLFLRGRLRGQSLQIDTTTLQLDVASDRAELRFRENARVLAKVDAEVWLIARVDARKPGRVLPLALRSDGMSLPDALDGLCNLGLDVLPGAVADATPAPVVVTPDPLAPLTRKLRRLALSGVRAVPAGAAKDVNRQARRLVELSMPGAATVLLQLQEARRRPEDLAGAYLRAHAYASLVEQHLLRVLWRQPTSASDGAAS